MEVVSKQEDTQMAEPTTIVEGQAVKKKRGRPKKGLNAVQQSAPLTSFFAPSRR